MLKHERQKVLEILKTFSKTLLSLDLGVVVPENLVGFKKTDMIYIIQD